MSFAVEQDSIAAIERVFGGFLDGITSTAAALTCEIPRDNYQR